MMIISIVKRYCICGGPANIGSVLETSPNEHMVEVVAGQIPEANLLTRGVDHARLIAHDLPFDRRMMTASVDNFTCLYADGRPTPAEFWSIEVTDGDKAVLKLLTMDEAKKVFGDLPQKLSPYTLLFDSERYKRQVEADRTANTDLKAAEKQKIAQAEWLALGPLERMGKTPPLNGWG